MWYGAMGTVCKSMGAIPNSKQLIMTALTRLVPNPAFRLDCHQNQIELARCAYILRDSACAPRQDCSRHLLVQRASDEHACRSLFSARGSAGRCCIE